MYKLLTFFFLFLSTAATYAQIGIGTTTPDPSSVLDISSTKAGLLIPRIQLESTTDIVTIPSPAVSLLVYNTNTVPSLNPGFYYWNGTEWIQLTTTGIIDPRWDLTGNMGTEPSANFLGTTDDVDMIFKRNNILAGRLSDINTSYGVNALSLDQGAGSIDNTAIGVNVLARNTDGFGNTGVGYGVLASNTGNNNTGMGRFALHNNRGSSSNTGIGSHALEKNISGSENTAVGSSALEENSTASKNTAVGFQALQKNFSGAENTAVGHQALQNNGTGSFNTAVGTQALLSNTTGNNNTAHGRYALRNNTEGYDNTAFGSSALVNNTTGGFLTAVGYNALVGNTTGDNNTAVGERALGGNTTGSNNIGIGFGAEVPDGTLNNQVRIGNAAVTYAGVQVGWTTTSDLRWKKNIENSNLGLQFIDQLHPVSYVRKNDASHQTEFGFIAQELKETLRKNGIVNFGMISEDNNGMLGVRYNDLFAPMIKAIQEQQDIIEQQQAAIERLEARLNAISKK